MLEVSGKKVGVKSELEVQLTLTTDAVPLHSVPTSWLTALQVLT